MFDTLNCDIPLPDSYETSGSFQTKDMENEMARYRITAQGRLVRETEGWFEDKKIDPPRDMKYHGMLRFYNLEKAKEKPDDQSRWTMHEYDAKFTDGQCVGIVQIKRQQPMNKNPRHHPEPEIR